MTSRAGGASLGNRTVDASVKLFLERDLPARRRGGRPAAPSTVTGYRWACGLVVDGLGWVRLDDLGAKHVEQFYDHLAAGDTGPSTASSLRKVRTTLHQVLAAAVRRGWIGQNVAAAAKLPDAAEAQPRRALSPAQARKLLETLRFEPNGLMCALSLRLGLRPGEESALTWADVERVDRRAVLHVRRGRRAVGGKVGVVNELKAAASRRQIELPPDLDEWVAACRRAAFGDTIRVRPDEALMFPGPTGRVLDPSNMRRELAAICRRAQDPTVRPNELRHSSRKAATQPGTRRNMTQVLIAVDGSTSTSLRWAPSSQRHRRRRSRPWSSTWWTRGSPSSSTARSGRCSPW